MEGGKESCLSGNTAGQSAHFKTVRLRLSPEAGDEMEPHSSTKEQRNDTDTQHQEFDTVVRLRSNDDNDQAYCGQRTLLTEAGYANSNQLEDKQISENERRQSAVVERERTAGNRLYQVKKWECWNNHSNLRSQMSSYHSQVSDNYHDGEQNQNTSSHRNEDSGSQHIMYTENSQSNNFKVKKIVTYKQESSVPSDQYEHYDQYDDNESEALQRLSQDSEFDDGRRMHEPPNISDQFNPVALMNQHENLLSEQNSSNNRTTVFNPHVFNEHNLPELPLQMPQIPDELQRQSSERISTQREEQKQSRLSRTGHRSSSNGSTLFNKGSSQLPVRQQNLYPQLSPQILHSSFKGRLMNADCFNDQDNRLNMAQAHAPHDSLSKPAIINQNSNTKKGGRSYLNRISPQYEHYPQVYTPVEVKEHSDTIGHEQLSEEDENGDHQAERNPQQPMHQHNPSSNSALKTTVNYGLSITNPTSQMQYGTFINEIDGLDLTDENLMEDQYNEDQNQPNMEMMNQHIDLSGIKESMKDNSYLISDTKTGNEQHDALRDLEQVEAELQEEVNQLDLLYKQHKQNSSKQRTSSHDYYDIAEYNKNEIVHPQLIDALQNYSHNLEAIEEEAPDHTETASVHLQLQDNYYYEDPHQNFNHHQPIPRPDNMRQPLTSQQRSSRTTQHDQPSWSINQYHQQHREGASSYIRHDNQNNDREEESSSDENANPLSSTQNLMFTEEINFVMYTQLQTQIQQLSDYKDLCERRIRDLLPGHPLPIQPQHIGQPNYAVIQKHQTQVQNLIQSHQLETKSLTDQIEELKRQLLQAKHMQSVSQQNSSSEDFSMQLNLQYNQMKKSFDQLKREKTELEKILRKETQLNEENHLKIQILKDRLENKVNESHQEHSLIHSHEVKAQGRFLSMRDALGSTQQISNKSATSDAHQLVDQMIQIGLLEETNKHLQNEISKLNAQLSTEKSMQDFNLQQQKKYESQIKALSLEGTGSIDQVLSKTQFLQKELKSRENDITFYKNQIMKLQAKIADLEADNCQNTVVIQEHSSMRNTLTNQSQQIAKMSKEINDLQSQNNQLKSQLSDRDNLRESMLMSIKSGHEQVSQFKDHFISETNQTLNLQKQLDQMNIQVQLLQQQKTIIQNEKSHLQKKHSLEIEGLRQLLDQNKQFIEDQEQVSLDKIQRLEDKLYQKANTSENMSLQQTQQIHSLNNQMQKLQQKLFTTELEAQAKDELHNLNVELEKKTELLQQQVDNQADHMRRLKTQLQSIELRNHTLSKKNEVQLQQIENLKEQNQWLKDEREQSVNQSSSLKVKLEQEQSQRQELKHSMELLQNKYKIDIDNFKLQTEKLSKQVQDLTATELTLKQHVNELKSEVNSGKAKLDEADTKAKQLKKEHAIAKEEVSFLQTQLADLKQENHMHYVSEDKTKALIQEIDKLKDLNFNLEKENQFNQKKIEDLKLEQIELERQARTLKQDKQDQEDARKHLDYQKKLKEQQMLDQLGEISKLKSQIDQMNSEMQKKQSQFNLSNCKSEELHSHLKRVQSLNEELKQQINRHIQKNNENCLRFQAEQNVLDSLVLIQADAQQSLIQPFVQSLKQQFEASDILKESLIFGYEYRIGSNDVEDGPTSLELQTKNEIFLNTLNTFVPKQNRHKDPSEQREKQVVDTQKLLLTTYIKFLQEEIIDRLIGSLIEHRSNIILQDKRQNQLNRTISDFKSQTHDKEQQIECLTIKLMKLEAENQELRSDQSLGRTCQATLKQQVNNLSNELAQVKKAATSKDMQLRELLEQNYTSNQTIEQTKAKATKFDQLEKQIKLLSVEKQHLWRLLKAVKVVVQSNNILESLEDMMNEYVVLLEQMVVHYQHKYFKGGDAYTSTRSSDEMAIQNITLKLKMVSDDIKLFRPKMKPNGSSEIPTKLMSNRDKLEKQASLTQNYMSLEQKKMSEQTLKRPSSQRWLENTQNLNQYNSVGL